MKRINFHISHLDLLDLQPEYRDVLNFDGVRFTLSRLNPPNSDAMTLMYEGRVICCMGYIQILPGVAEVWLLPSIYLSDCTVSFVKEVHGFLGAIAKTFRWHRIQTVTKDSVQHRKWMKVLGFVEEGILKNYYDQKDYIMSARYFDRGES